MALTGTEQPNSPAVDATNGRVVVQRLRYHRTYDCEAEMPARGTYTAGCGYVKGYRLTPSGQYTDAEVVYGEVDDYTPEADDTVYSFRSDTYEEPIETHPDYLMCWRYNLYHVDHFAADDPAWWATATTPADADGKEWVWSVEHPGDGWQLQKVATKPGVQAYLAPSVVVVRQSYYGTRAAAEAARIDVGKRATPAQTFDVTGGNWLVTSCGIAIDQRLWCVTTEYTHSTSGWDTDLYEAAS